MHPSNEGSGAITSKNPARQQGIDSVFALMDGGTKATSEGREWGPGHLPFDAAPGRMWLESTTVGFSENAAPSCHCLSEADPGWEKAPNLSLGFSGSPRKQLTMKCNYIYSAGIEIHYDWKYFEGSINDLFKVVLSFGASSRSVCNS